MSRRRLESSPPTSFVLTKHPQLARLTRVTLDRAIERIQFCYPQVYYACHTRHDRARSTTAHLSARDATILVHLDRSNPVTVSSLARHLHLSPSTLSEALTRLETLGYVHKSRETSADRRKVGLVLTGKGADAVRASSVLEARRLRAVLSRLAATDRLVAVAGLELLARACRTTDARGRRR